MAAYGLYTYIQSNKRKSIALLIGLFVLVYVMVFAGALLAEALTVNAPIDYLLRAAEFDFIKALPLRDRRRAGLDRHRLFFPPVDDRRGDRRSAEVTRQQEPRLYNLLENLCISRGIAMPTLRVAEDPALNAFSTGLTQKQYSITVMRGLMNALDDAEIESVLGHELTHIRNGDVQMMVIAVVIAGAISFFGEMVFRLFFQASFYGGYGGFRRRGGDDRQGGGAGRRITHRAGADRGAWILSVVIQFALSREREYLADAGSVELTKNPDAMISALRKIEGRGELTHADLGGDGIVRRQSARGLFQYLRHASLRRGPRRRDHQIRRRPRSRAAGAGSAASASARRCRAGRSGPWSEPPQQPAPSKALGDRSRGRQAVGRRALGTAPRLVHLSLLARKGKLMPLERDQRPALHVEVAQFVGAADRGQGGVEQTAGTFAPICRIVSPRPRRFRRRRSGRPLGAPPRRNAAAPSSLTT